MFYLKNIHTEKLLTSPEGTVLTWQEKPSFENENPSLCLRQIANHFRNELGDNLTELDLQVIEEE